jgi:hypothetical protein
MATTYRKLLQSAGAATVAALSFSSAAAASEWTSVEAPTGKNINDVAYTDEGAYAVAGGGIVLKRTDQGWKKVIDGGPSGNGNDLYGASVTDDGERLWFVGASGAVGEYDVTTQTLTDRSKPDGSSNNFNDVAVTGSSGEANVYVSGDSGQVFYSFDNGKSQTWNLVTPGSGSALKAIDFFASKAGNVVDTNQKVFETDDGETWDAIGIANAGVNFYGTDSDAADDVWVSGGNGKVFQWNGNKWTPQDLGDASLRDIELNDGNSAGLTVGNGGKIFQFDGSSWQQQQTPTGANLKAVVRGSPDIAVGASGSPDIAVGASGTILER